MVTAGSSNVVVSSYSAFGGPFLFTPTSPSAIVTRCCGWSSNQVGKANSWPNSAALAVSGPSAKVSSTGVIVKEALDVPVGIVTMKNQSGAHAALV